MRADPAAVHAPCMARRAWTCPRMSMLEHGPPACEQSTRGRTFALPGLIIASVKTDERPRLPAARGSGPGEREQDTRGGRRLRSSEKSACNCCTVSERTHCTWTGMLFYLLLYFIFFLLFHSGGEARVAEFLIRRCRDSRVPRGPTRLCHSVFALSLCAGKIEYVYVTPIKSQRQPAKHEAKHAVHQVVLLNSRGR